MVVVSLVVRETVRTSYVVESDVRAGLCSRYDHIVSFNKLDVNWSGSYFVVILSPLNIF